jgi:hypothetical protein
MDGTFNQGKPLTRIPWKNPELVLFSLDLSSATDRLPISLQTKLLSSLFNVSFAKAWETLLVGRPYFLSISKYNFIDRELKYGVGQPMGALSS